MFEEFALVVANLVEKPSFPCLVSAGCNLVSSRVLVSCPFSYHWALCHLPHPVTFLQRRTTASCFSNEFCLEPSQLTGPLCNVFTVNVPMYYIRSGILHLPMRTLHVFLSCLFVLQCRPCRPRCLRLLPG